MYEKEGFYIMGDLMVSSDLSNVTDLPLSCLELMTTSFF
jgi:hypothetical protein